MEVKEVTSYFNVKRFFFFFVPQLLDTVCVRVLFKRMSTHILYVSTIHSHSEVNYTWYVKLSWPQKTS